MSDDRKITVSIQGKAGAGKTQLSLQVIEPALLAIGATIDKKRDEKTGVFLTVSLKPNSLSPPPDGMKQVYSRGELLAAIDVAARGAADGSAREQPEAVEPARIGFASFERVRQLVTARRELVPYADECGNLAPIVARMTLPKSLVNLTEPTLLTAQLRQDARDGIARIDAELLQLGFDISPVQPD